MYDFSTGIGQYYGTNPGRAKILETGVYGVIAGDCNQDGNITISDNNIIMTNRNREGYQKGDLNMDGNVTIADNNKCIVNRNKSTQVP